MDQGVGIHGLGSLGAGVASDGFINTGGLSRSSISNIPTTAGVDIGVTGEEENPFITEQDAQRHHQQMAAQLRAFWQEQMEEMDKLEVSPENGEFKNHNDLPLARIKRIMKSDEDVRMISAEAPVLFAKACEMFILELTLRSWCYSEKNKRRTLQKEDIQTAIRRTEIFDFLVDVIQ